MQTTFRRKSIVIVFLLPAFLIYTALVLVSIVCAVYYSFFDWSGVGGMTFTGFNNYITLLTTDKAFWESVLHTLIYTVINVMVQIFAGLLFAVFLTRITRFRACLQTLYYVPVVISSVALCQILAKLFSVTPAGVINTLLSQADSRFLYMEWISNADLALLMAAFAEAYKYLGLYMVIFYAALIGVPGDLSEAAIVDGAGVFRQYWNIKIPYIRPVIIANCILVLNGSLRSFEFSYLLTRGGPGGASELMTTYMYKQAFTSQKYGYGSSVAVMIVVVCLIIGFLFRRFARDGDEV